jgi:hypothetical protein
MEVFSVWSVLRLYNEERPRLRESLETGVSGVESLWVQNSAVGSQLSEGPAVKQATASKDVQPWTRRWKPLPDNWWTKSKLRELSTCCSELQSVWIIDSAIVTCSYVLYVFIKSNYQFKPCLYSHSYTWQYIYTHTIWGVTGKCGQIWAWGPYTKTRKNSHINTCLEAIILWVMVEIVQL